MVSKSESLACNHIEPAPPDEPPKTHSSLSSLARQPSIYSLTLDEFQNTLCENGKNFGSMNMDEFLSNIWTAEENQTIHTSDQVLPPDQDDPTRTKTLATQPGLHRQGSFSVPSPLCQKTVEEVWSQIHKDRQQQQNPNNVGNPGTATLQPTFGEMTLEDFLIKAGVVRETCGPSSQRPLQSLATALDTNFGIGQVMGIGLSDHRNTGNALSGGIPVYQTLPQNGGVVGESSNYGRDGKRNGGFPAEVCFGRRVGMGSPVSPVSSDGMCTSQVDNSVSQYGLEMGGIRGRRRIIDGPVEVVVERRQRRMIKNRESAARSRARKQAYTVELEAALNQLQEENVCLKQTLAEAEKKRRQELLEEMKKKPPTKVQKTTEKFRLLRRTSSTPK